MKIKFTNLYFKVSAEINLMFPKVAVFIFQVKDLFVLWLVIYTEGKCPKISNTKVADKMTFADSADPDQTAPEGAVWSRSTLFAISLSILRNNCIKSKKVGQNKYGIKCSKF